MTITMMTTMRMRMRMTVTITMIHDDSEWVRVSSRRMGNQLPVKLTPQRKLQGSWITLFVSSSLFLKIYIYIFVLKFFRFLQSRRKAMPSKIFILIFPSATTLGIFVLGIFAMVFVQPTSHTLAIFHRTWNGFEAFHLCNWIGSSAISMHIGHAKNAFPEKQWAFPFVGKWWVETSITSTTWPWILREHQHACSGFDKLHRLHGYFNYRELPFNSHCDSRASFQVVANSQDRNKAVRQATIKHPCDVSLWREPWPLQADDRKRRCQASNVPKTSLGVSFCIPITNVTT